MGAQQRSSDAAATRFRRRGPRALLLPHGAVPAAHGQLGDQTRLGEGLPTCRKPYHPGAVLPCFEETGAFVFYSSFPRPRLKRREISSV